MSRDKEILITITEPITLEDLRWLVDECNGLHEDSKVEIHDRQSHDPRDYDAAKIVVHGRKDIE